jgi:hypothetical protein
MWERSFFAASILKGRKGQKAQPGLQQQERMGVMVKR